VSEAVALVERPSARHGSDLDMEPLIGSATKVLDLRGRLATPGLYEAHLTSCRSASR
jgi:predicted amidohydrolase YtcJ